MFTVFSFIFKTSKLCRDRLEDMRLMYDTAAECNSNVSFDSADPFYDSLPWFRLVGRYSLHLPDYLLPFFTETRFFCVVSFVDPLYT